MKGKKCKRVYKQKHRDLMKLVEAALPKPGVHPAYDRSSTFPIQESQFESLEELLLREPA